jgi:hypothetical protein
VVEKGPCRGKPLSVRGIQKRMEYHARRARVPCQLPPTAADHGPQMLNADAPLVSIQDLLGHNRFCPNVRNGTETRGAGQKDVVPANDHTKPEQIIDLTIRQPEPNLQFPKATYLFC